jgi:chromosome segregation ATPase
MFERANQAGISPEYYDKWAELMNLLTQKGFHAGDLLNAATKLHALEVDTGKSYETVIQELNMAKDYLAQVKAEAAAFDNKKTSLSKEIASLLSQKENVSLEEKKLLSEVEKLTATRKQLESAVGEAKGECSKVKQEVVGLKLQRAKLAAEVDEREASLTRINELGLSDKELFHLKKSLQTIAQSSAGQEQVRDKFFAMLDTFEDVFELEKRKAEEIAALDHLTGERALLTGQLAALEQSKNIIQGQITEATLSAISNIKETGDKAALELRQQTNGIKQSFDGLVAQAVEAGMAVGEMKAAVKKGEESQTMLRNFIRDVKNTEVKTDG